MTGHIETLNYITRELSILMSQFGYQMMETPILDKADLFLTKAGDQAIEQLFVFEHQGQQWALRPEFTASATYQYIEAFKDIQTVRWQFHGLIFEDQSHLQQQHYQKHSAGAELIGVNGCSADAEIIAMAIQGIAKLGIANWRLTIGHIGLLRHLLADFQLDDRILRFLLSQRHILREKGKQAVLEALDHYLPQNLAGFEIGVSDNAEAHQVVDTVLEASGGGKTMGGRTRADVSRRLLKKRQQATQRDQIVKAIDFLDTWTSLYGEQTQILEVLNSFTSQNVEAQSTLDDLRTTLNILEAYAIPENNILLVPDLARNWDYYTGIVFEIISDDGELLCGGGRYDGLAYLFGGASTIPAIGMAYQVENLAKHVQVATSENFIITLIDDKTTDTFHAPRWATQFRQQGIPTIIQFAGANSDDASPIQLSINSGGQIHWHGRLYIPIEIDTLIADIKKVVANGE